MALHVFAATSGNFWEAPRAAIAVKKTFHWSEWSCRNSLSIWLWTGRASLRKQQANQKRGSWILIRQDKIFLFLEELLKEELYKYIEMVFGTYTTNIYSIKT